MLFGNALKKAQRHQKKKRSKKKGTHLGEPEHVHRPEEARLDRLDRVVLVVHGARRARQVVDLVDLEQDLLDDVVADQLEVRLVHQVRDVLLRAREEVVEADNVVAALDEERAEVRADEARAARDDDAVGLDAGLGLDEGVVGALLFFSLVVVESGGGGGGRVFLMRSRSRRKRERKKERASFPLFSQLSIEAKACANLPRFPPSFRAFGYQYAAGIASINACTCSRRKERARATRCEGSVAAGRVSKRGSQLQRESIDAKKQKSSFFFRIPLHTRATRAVVEGR